jgi:uncharacterized protein (TIGR00730 family)
MKRICIFCGSSKGALPDYADAARYVGTMLARRGISVVYGGGNIGLMGVVADAALAEGGEVIGVIPRKLIERELAHHHVTTLIPVDTMHQRKQQMAELSDAFLALPGGIGTLEEVFEAFTWLQLGFHTKPVGLLNVSQFYDSLLVFLDHVLEQKFIKKAHLDTLLVENTIEPLLDRMAAFRPTHVNKVS